MSEQERDLAEVARQNLYLRGAYDFARWLDTSGFDMGIGWYDALEGFYDIDPNLSDDGRRAKLQELAALSIPSG